MKNELIHQMISRYASDKGIQSLKDVMVAETSFDLYVNGKVFNSMYCTPSHLDELVIGHLSFEGIISRPEDITSFEYRDNDIYVNVNPCLEGLGNPQIPCREITCFAEDIVTLMKNHLNSSELHKLTGGVHIMSLSDGKSLIVRREDVGRHNAVDKLYGYCLKNNIDCSDKILLSSGRVTHEIISKIIKMGIKIVVSRAAVTSLAREIAVKAGICVIGFARGERFNIYSFPQRILVKNSR